MKQIDIETAFLNGKLEQKVYIRPPDGYRGNKEHILLLLKALYGLKQSPKSWYLKLKEVLLSFSFKQSTVELCLYVFQKDDIFVMLISYVDDMLIAGSSEKTVQMIIDVLKENFNLRVIDNIQYFIGFHLSINSDYIETMTKRFKIEDSKPVKTPMEPKLNLEKGNGKIDVNKNCVLRFQRLLGAISYVAERTRPDVGFATNKLSCFTLQATDKVYKYLVCVLRYLYTTKDIKLYYRPGNNVPLEAYSDASWASEPDRRSTTGYIVRVFGNLIHYKSRKQSIVALSTCESEYVALSECARDVAWVRNLLNDMNVSVMRCTYMVIIRHP